MAAGARNWASAEFGAVVADSSTDSQQTISSASNILVDREDLLWITGQLPQQVVLQTDADHSPFRYVGWHAWHDYLTNPKTVEVASGSSPNDLTTGLVCTALPGGGTQLWEVPQTIPSHHRYVRFRIVSAFGATTSYMNRVFLFSEHPGPGYTSRAPVAMEVPQAAAVGPKSPKSPMRMAGLLKDLDEEIRQLHPLKHVSPQRAHVFQSLSESSQSQQHQRSAQNVNVALNQSSRALVAGSAIGAGNAVDNKIVDRRLESLEQALLRLAEQMDSQRQSIDSLHSIVKRGIEAPAADARRYQTPAPPPPPPPPPPPAVSVPTQFEMGRGPPHDVLAPFPVEALRNYVEDVLAPKLSKFGRRTEERVMQQMEEKFNALSNGITSMVDEQVRNYLHTIALDVEHPFHYHFRHGIPCEEPSHKIPHVFVAENTLRPAAASKENRPDIPSMGGRTRSPPAPYRDPVLSAAYGHGRKPVSSGLHGKFDARRR